MRVIIAVTLIVGLAFIIVFALTDLIRDLSRHSYPPSFDESNGDEWDAAEDEARADDPHVSYTEQ
jgi:hypothetical protein